VYEVPGVGLPKRVLGGRCDGRRLGHCRVSVNGISASPEPDGEVLKNGRPSKGGLGCVPRRGAERESEGGLPLYLRSRIQLSKNRFGEGVKAEFLVRIRPRVQCTVVHTRVRDGKEGVLTEVDVHCPRPHHKRWGLPSMIALGQTKRFLLGRSVLTFPTYVQVRVCPSGTREGVSNGRGRVPSKKSSFTVDRMRRSQGACP